MRGILHANQPRSTESSSPRTARGELGPTRLGEADGVVTVNKLSGVRRAPTIWDQSPCIGQVLGTVLELVAG